MIQHHSHNDSKGFLLILLYVTKFNNCIFILNNTIIIRPKQIIGYQCIIPFHECKK